VGFNLFYKGPAYRIQIDLRKEEEFVNYSFFFLLSLGGGVLLCAVGGDSREIDTVATRWIKFVRSFVRPLVR